MTRKITLIIVSYILLYTISIGQNFEFSKIRFSGNTIFSHSTLSLRVESLIPINPATINQHLEEIYHQSGYAFAKVTNEIKNPDSLIISILEGPFCSINLVSGFTDSVHIPYFDNIPKTYIAKEVHNSIDNWVIQQEELGRPLYTVEIGDLKIISQNSDTAKVEIELSFQNTELIKIDEIIISGAEYTEEQIILRELEWARNLPYTPTIKRELQESLYKLRIFESVNEPEIVETDSGRAVLIHVVEGQTTTFDGIIGYIPEQTTNGTTREGYFTGLLDLNFANLFGTARKLSVHWQKPDAQSDQFNIRYKEPWILGTPMSGVVGFHRRVQDTLFLKQGYGFEVEYPLGYQWQLYARFNQNFTKPDSIAAMERGITENTHTQYITGIRFDTRDLPSNPSKGMVWDVYFSYGNKKIDGPSYLLEADSTIESSQDTQILKFVGWAFLETFRNQVAAFKIDVSYLNVDPGRPDDADLFWFGGAGSLRGYRENQFRSDKYVIGSFEYRFLTGRRSRLFGFVDQAVFNNFGKTIYRTGYGVGVRFQTGLGILAIDYGLGEDDPFSQGKIHIGIVNEF